MESSEIRMHAHRSGKRAVRIRRRSRSEVARALEPELAPLGAELTGICAAALRDYGLKAREILKDCAAGRSRGAAPVARRLLHDVFALGDLATEWTESPAYLAADGKPADIPIKGKGVSFQSLAQAHFGHRRLSDILEFAQRTDVVKRTGENTVGLRNACVMLTGNRVLLLARAVLSVRWLLGAARANGARGESVELWPDRQAYAAVPAGKFGQFADLMRPQLYSLANTGNRWLAQHAVRDEARPTRRKQGLVGVHAYVFHE